MLAYVYRLIDTHNGKYYIGSNYRKGCDPSWLGKSYFTSSGFIRKLFQRDRSRFETEILCTGTVDDVIAFETETLQRLDARRDPNSYNCHNNETQLNSKKVGVLTRDLRIGVHGRTKEKVQEDVARAGKVSCDLRHAEKDVDGKSIFAKRIGYASHTVKDQRGKSARMVEVGKNTMKKLHSEKDENGKSKMVMQKYKCAQCEFTHISMVMGKHHITTGHTGKHLI